MNSTATETDTQVQAAEEIARVNPQWRWSRIRKDLSFRDSHAVELQPFSHKWVAYANSIMLTNGLKPFLFDSPRAAIMAMGFNLY
jgi:hypothetical protein